MSRAGPRLAATASTTKNGKNTICVRQYAEPRHQQRQHSEGDGEIDQRDDRRGTRHDQAGEIDLADQVGIATKTIRSFDRIAAKRNQGSMPAKTSSGYGTFPSVGSFAT